MDKFLIIGNGGRESAFALALYKEVKLYALMAYENPTIATCVNQSGGSFHIDNPNEPQVVLNFAQKNDVDYVFVSADDPLANGVVDVLLENGIKAVGGTKEATRIEWDKIYSIDMVQKVCPEFTPFYRVVSDDSNIDRALEEFRNKNMELVVKPQGLTGGKGVKVMPNHLKTYDEAKKYILQLLRDKPQEKVLLVEKLEGVEFTIMGITDGESLVLSPSSYDYPYRFEGDQGAGTGGMGCFTCVTKKLPFMTDKDLEDCDYVMTKIIKEIKSRGLNFNGVLNGGFFVTKQGIKFMEFNGRFGDPEGLNILSVLDTSFAQLIIDIYNKNLSEKSIKFVKKASVIKYLVAREYPNPSPEALEFFVHEEAISKMGIDIFHGADVKIGANKFQTLKKSRVVALGCLADTVKDASDLINEAISLHIKGDLDYRRDIGSADSLTQLMSFHSND